MPKTEQSALEDDDVREAVVEACCRSACDVDGVNPDALVGDLDVKEGEPARLVRTWQNYRRQVLLTLAIVGTASTAMNNLTGMKAAGDKAAAGG